MKYKDGPDIAFMDVKINIRILSGIIIIFPGLDLMMLESEVVYFRFKEKDDFLLCNDIDLDHPEVVAELNRWGKWVSNELDLDGMRLDAIKHMKDQFVTQFLDTVRSERGDDFYAVGELER